MFCSKCGSQNPDGAAFCNNCGNSLQSPGVYSQQPQTQYAPPQGFSQSVPYAGYPQVKRKKKGFMIGLIIGGIVLVAGIILLVVLLSKGQNSPPNPSETTETYDWPSGEIDDPTFNLDDLDLSDF